MDDKRTSLVPAVTLSAALALGGALATPNAIAGPLAPAFGSSDVMIAIPSRPDAELLVLDRKDSAEAAFAKLDAEGKGYIARGDVSLMPEFDNAFRASDADQDGNLTQQEFRNAWESYTTPR